MPKDKGKPLNCHSCVRGVNDEIHSLELGNNNPRTPKYYYSQTTTLVPRSTTDSSLIVLLFALLIVAVTFAIIFLKRKPEERYLKESSRARISEGDIVYCPSCGKENLKGVSFCKHCGTPLKPLEKLQREQFLKVLQRKLDNGEISEEEYRKALEKLEKGL